MPGKGRPFGRGQSGNPKGRPKGAITHEKREMLAFFAEVSNDPNWQRSALTRMLAGKAPHLEAYMINKLGGKPVDKHEITGKDGGPVTVREIRNMLVGDESRQPS